MSREELIAALEKATGPDRALDLRIARDVLNSEPLGHAAGMTDDMLMVDGGRFGPWPRYTASIDAALTLVPEGWEWIVFGAGGADVWHVGSDAVLHRIDETYAPTPALALCIAALKARAT